MKDSEIVRKLIAKAFAAGNYAQQQQTYLLHAIAEGIAALLEWKEAE